MDVTVNIKNLDKLIAKLNFAPASIQMYMKEAINSSIYTIERVAVPKVPVDTSFLMNQREKSIMPWVGRLAFTAPYAMFVHGDGTAERSKPHFPPIKAVEGWAKRHGINPYLVARSISRKGTKLIPFLSQGIEESNSAIDAFFKQALDEVTNELGD